MDGGTLLIGLGDVRHGDDGFGPRVLEAMQRVAEPDAAIVTLDTPAIGMRLLPLLCVVRRVLVVTATHTGAAPGSVRRLEWEGRADDLGPRLPAIRRHGIELLRSLHFWMAPVPDLVVLGVEAERTEGEELSPLVALAVQPVANACLAELRCWGHPVTRQPAERVPA